MKTLFELIRFFYKRKKFWMVPLLIVLLVAGLLVFASQIPVVGPFIYTLF